ncbi:PD-(D/E)XK nuclease family protein [Actinocrinis puniceicyclus]|uniref:PD-(D/E)XK nuclease family protein n=1 Tax=Actinocrinis puniceicyclus TaxID=977794 RepID=A0A8J7WLD3_9ACTN|nr:PD-(D/E)XK nuclease family protein [Actinocrinis puniceicyclus]MBS2961620.1 PD-(D/E)XK nuclease family protein [Actinocrinis puniceicyclus]
MEGTVTAEDDPAAERGPAAESATAARGDAQRGGAPAAVAAEAPAVIKSPGCGGTESGTLFDVDVPVRLPSALSPSRAGDFMQCPLLYRLRVVDKSPEPPNAAAARGTLVHAVLDRLFDLPAGGRTPDEAAALLQPEWDRLLVKDPRLGQLFGAPEDLADWLATAKSLLGRYFTLEDPNRLEPARREWFVRAVVGEGDERFVLHGVVDRLDVAPNGLLRVVDYKTGKAPSAAYEAKNLFQMKFYALVLWKLRDVVPKRLQLIFLGSGDVLTYDPDEQDLRGMEQKITAVWAAIRAAAQRREWPASPSRLCDWCSFKAGCPAHGGQVPPAPVVEFTPAS